MADEIVFNEHFAPDPVLKLKEALDNLPDEFFDVCCEVNENIWGRVDRDVYWNIDDHLEDLLYGNGNTYSGYSRTGWYEYGNWVQGEIDTQQGYTVTMFFRKDKEVKYEEDD